MVTEEDIKRYLEKSGDSTIDMENIVVNDHGFMSWVIDHEGDFFGINVYGDGKYWDDFSIALDKQLGCKKIKFATRRNPKVWEKKFGYNIAGYIMEKEV